MAQQSFCSDIGRASDEPLLGSALDARHYIFVSWPRQTWSSRQYESQGFPAELASYLSQLQKEYGAVTRLIYRRGMDTKLCKVMIMPENIVAEGLTTKEVQDALSKVFPMTNKPLNSTVWRDSSERRLFVCTHGKRDLCCAKYGYDLYKSCRDLISNRSVALDLWECTHVGGDRFAANAIVFPFGHMYGHLRAGHAESLINAAESGMPYSPCFRGSVLLSGVRQLADAYGYKYCAERQIAANFTIGDPQHDLGERVYIDLIFHDSRTRVLRLSCVRTSFEVTIDCQQLMNEKRKNVKRWVVESAQEIIN